MKKSISLLLALTMLCAFCACGGSEWTREGYFADEEGNFLSITWFDDDENPGFYVGAFLGDEMYGNMVEQKGKTLYGNIKIDDDADSPDFIVTIKEEGKDGVSLTTESGETYHFTLMDIPEAAFSVSVDTDGFGQIAYAKEGEEIAFDEEYPSSSAYVGLEEPETYIFAAKPDEGYKLLKWTKNGEDFSKDEQITLEITEDTELVAVFGIKGTDETYVDLASVTTLGELLGLPDYGTSAGEGKYVYAFEQDGVFYRAVAECPQDILDKVIDLDWDDPQYDEKLKGLISDLSVERIDNLSEGIPSQEELDKLVGKTGKDLFDEGWSNFGWNLETMEFFMDKGPYSFTVVFEGEIKNYDTFAEEDINALTVKSVKYDRMGSMTELD